MPNVPISLLALSAALASAPLALSAATVMPLDAPSHMAGAATPGFASLHAPFLHVASDAVQADALSDILRDFSRVAAFQPASCGGAETDEAADTEFEAFRRYVKYVDRQALVPNPLFDDTRGTTLYEAALSNYVWLNDNLSTRATHRGPLAARMKDNRDQAGRNRSDTQSHGSRSTGLTIESAGRQISGDCLPADENPILASLFETAGPFAVTGGNAGNAFAPFRTVSGGGRGFGSTGGGGTTPSGGTGTPSSSIANPVPLPAGLALLLSALGVIGGFSIRRRNS